jgi:L-2,4-diaminobutyric acid acetyltransferase
MTDIQSRPYSKLRSLVKIDKPIADDGPAVHDLIARCKPLDENSLYCNLLHCSHFAPTSAIAKMGDKVVGFVSGYLLPEDPSRLFIWQVAVAPQGRGQGLAKRMMLDILSRPICEDVSKLQTTITADNAASQAVFTSLAESLGADVSRKVMFERHRHLAGEHASEYLWVIGPFSEADEEGKRDAA